MIAREPLATVQPELEPLSILHHAEVSPPDTPLAINWGLLRAMDEACSLVCHTARQDGTLVGYDLHIISPHPLYGELWMTPVALYVRPEYRGFGHGFALIKVVERYGRDRGVAMVCQAAPSSELAHVLSRMNYWSTETTWAKRVRA